MITPSRLEHIALNVTDPVGMARWYSENLGLRVVRTVGDISNTTFLAAGNGEVLIEFYCNSLAPVPAYGTMHPLELHLAFSSDDPQTDANRLLKAGAALSDPLVITAAGDRLIMLRDPFGLALQLVCRAKPMLKESAGAALS